MIKRALALILVFLMCSQAEATLLTNITSYWEMEESGTNNRIDQLGLNTLSASAGMTNNTGIIGNASNYNGSSDLSVADSPSLGIGGASAMTISLWVYLGASGENQTLVAKWNYPTQGVFAIQTIPGGSFDDGIRAFIALTPDDGGGCLADVAADLLPAGAFVHVVIVFDGTLSGNSNRLKFYVNSVLQTVSFPGSDIPATLVDTGSALRFGQFEGVGRFLSSGSRVDEVGLWSRALTGAEVTSLYNGGAANQYPFGLTSTPSADSMMLEGLGG